MPDLAQIRAAKAARLNQAARKHVMKGVSSPKDALHHATAAKQERHQNEIARILSAPLSDGIDTDVEDAINEMFLQPAEYQNPDGYRLRYIQAYSLYNFISFGCMFGPIGVGKGKTLTSLLLSQIEYSNGGHKVMLIIPAGLVPQLVKQDLPEYRTKVQFNMPVHVLYKISSAKKLMMARSGRRGLYIFTYSGLEAPNAREVLEAVDPSLIIADEAHFLSDSRKSARSKRFNEFLEEKRPKFIPLSGTMTKTSPMDYFSLVKNSLRDRSFMPLIKVMAQNLSMEIGTSASPVESASAVNPSIASPWIAWGRQNFPEDSFEMSVSGLRKAFAYRASTTEGVADDEGDSLGITMNIINDPHPDPESEPGWSDLQQYVEDLNGLEMVTPTGEELPHAMLRWKWLYEIEGAGFYNERYWPDEDWVMSRKQISRARAQSLLEMSKEWLEEYRTYQKRLGEFLDEFSSPGLDTPHLVELSLGKFGADKVGHILFNAWKQTHHPRYDGHLDRLKRTVRVCPFKINQAVNWYKTLPEGEGAILWFYSNEIGKWLYEAFTEAGLDPVYCPSGSKYNDLVIRKEHKDKPLIAASCHTFGRNLQHFKHMRFVQWFRSATVIEQGLGRILRLGQTSSEVYACTHFQGEFDHANMAAPLNDAAYMHQSLKDRQILMEAVYSPKPKVVPYEVLKHWGAVDSHSTQDKEAAKLLKRLFGG